MNMKPLLSVASLALGAAVALTQTAAPALAQAYPNKSITMVQAFAAGGGMDPVARLIANEMEKQFGQQIVMDYRAGAGGSIGTAYAVKAPADGYTILISPGGPIITSKYLIAGVPYDGLKDLQPISMIAETPLVIVANSEKIKAKTLPELIAYAKANPDTVTAANVGIGSGGHLSAVLLEKIAGIKLRHVPYKGTGQMMADLVSGQVDLTINFFAGFGPHVDKGTMHVISVLSDKNVPESLKKYPSSASAGFPALNVTGYYALFAPKGTPAEAVNKLNGLVANYLKTDLAKQKLGDLGYTTASSTPDELTKYLINEDVKWGSLIKEVGLKPE
jgi:tripartite-type tricarboxylate transporter receptor subunit TctC